MPRYIVHVTITFPGWREIEADSAAAAIEEARELPADLFEVNTSAGEVDYTVTPTAVPA